MLVMVLDGTFHITYERGLPVLMCHLENGLAGQNISNLCFF